MSEVVVARACRKGALAVVGPGGVVAVLERPGPLLPEHVVQCRRPLLTFGRAQGDVDGVGVSERPPLADGRLDMMDVLQESTRVSAAAYAPVRTTWSRAGGNVTDALRWRSVCVDGRRLWYSVVGRGPAVVLPKKDRGDYLPTRLLADQYKLIQVEPLGFGRSDRPVTYPRGGVPRQVLAVCNAEGVDEFAVWGFSQGGAMACTVAQATSRARLLVCGGFNPLRGLSDAWLARMNREQRVPLGSREFSNYFHTFDWHRELRRLDVPILMYAGTVDTQRLSRSERHILHALGADVVEFDGLDHRRSGLVEPESPATLAVSEWLQHNAWGESPLGGATSDVPRCRCGCWVES